MKPIRIAALAALAAFGIVACEDSPTDTRTDEERTLDAIVEATAGYSQVAAALAAGYTPMGPCVAAPPGAMGIHYMKPSLIDAVVDPEAPESLLFMPTAGGQLELVGVEFVVMADDWTGTQPPTLAGRPFDDHREPAAAHGMPPHFDLHVWAHRENPAGLYAPFNPTLSCP